MDRITLNKDIFYHMFDFLRIDGLFACQFLSKDIHQRVLQRMSSNDNKVIQIKSIDDFVELFSNINGCRIFSKGYITEWLENNISDYDYGFSSNPILYKAFSIHDVYLYFHAEFMLDIAYDERILNSVIFIHGIYDGHQFRKKYEQILSGCEVTWFTDTFKVDRNHCCIYHNQDPNDWYEITFNPKSFYEKLINNKKDSNNNKHSSAVIDLCVDANDFTIDLTDGADVSAKIIQEKFKKKTESSNNNCGSCLPCKLRLDENIDIKQGCYKRQCL